MLPALRSMRTACTHDKFPRRPASTHRFLKLIDPHTYRTYRGRKMAAAAARGRRPTTSGGRMLPAQGVDAGIAAIMPRLLLLALLALLVGVHGSQSSTAYDAYLEEHGKAHEDEAAREAGMQHFMHTDAYIREFNSGRRLSSSPSFSLRHSRFSDLSEEERAAFFWRPHPDAAHFLLDDSLRMTAEEEAALLVGVGWGGVGDKREEEVLPRNLNWATTENPLGRSVVTPPLNQGHCGGCWSIVAASVVESGVALRHGPLTPLSAQELLDCDTAWNAGCQGGNPIQSFDFIKENGLAAAAAYPYQGQQLPCRKADVVPVSSIESYRILRSYDEALLLRAVARQPVAVGVAGQHASFLFYGGGIYDDESCGTELNHALVLVGYGTDEKTGQEFWHAKNSWGKGWGENGFIRLLRNKNLCGLATAPSIPLGAYGGNATALLEARKQQRSSLFPNPFRPSSDSPGPGADSNDQPLPPAPTNRPFDLPSWLKKSLPGLFTIVFLLAVGAYFFGRPPPPSSTATAPAPAGGYYQQQQEQQPQPPHAGGGVYQSIGSAARGGFPAAVEGTGAAAGGRYGAV